MTACHINHMNVVADMLLAIARLTGALGAVAKIHLRVLVAVLPAREAAKPGLVQAGIGFCPLGLDLHPAAAVPQVEHDVLAEKKEEVGRGGEDAEPDGPIAAEKRVGK